MTTEIDRIAERCRDCGTATAFVIIARDIDDNGAQRMCVRTEQVPHSRSDCSRLLKIAKEEWPCLF